MRCCKIPKMKAAASSFKLKTISVQSVRAWRFVAEHWDELNERFPSNTIVRMIAAIATFVDPAVEAEVREFFAEHPLPQGAKSLAQHLEKLSVNVALAEREGPRLAAALR